ncbi:hypothetical protein BDW67DRAFT_181879 [Aspergillus spinulosporus]
MAALTTTLLKRQATVTISGLLRPATSKTATPHRHPPPNCLEVLLPRAVKARSHLFGIKTLEIELTLVGTKGTASREIVSDLKYQRRL